MFGFNFSEEYILVIISTAAALMGATAGVVGSFTVLRKNSLLPDSIAVASFFGIALAFILTGLRNHNIFLIGAAIAGFVAVGQTLLLIRNKNLRFGSSLNFLHALYFGFGIVLLSYIQHKPEAGKTGIETFLLGRAATMLVTDVQVMALISGFVLLVVFIQRRDFFMVALDRDYATACGLPVRKLDILFYTILVATVVSGLHIMGVILMGAIIIIPATAARQWTKNFTLMTFLSAFFGAISGMVGSIASGAIVTLHTGPAVVACAGVIAFLSFLIAPRRGVVPSRLRKKGQKKLRINENAMLDTLYMLSVLHKSNVHGHSYATISALFPTVDKNNTQDVQDILINLKKEGLAVETSAGFWSITPSGAAIAEKTTEYVFDARGVVK